MYLLIIFLPLLNFITLINFSFFFNKNLLKNFALTNMLVSFFISCIVFYEIVLYQDPAIISLDFWIQSNLLEVRWTFLYDTLTAVMLIVVTSISTCVHFYSVEYMGEDPHLQRFISYLSFFTFFMLVLVTSNNLLQLFVGWEGVGLCSYLLINFWFQRIQANKAALKAMIVNRVGDFGLAMGLFTIFFYAQSLDYSIINALSTHIYNSSFILENFSINIINLSCIFLFIGAVGKSAQIGLHTWLPDAMEGPTPVSALIHAATMVTAGIFLICRNSALFQESPYASILITVLGSITAFIAGTIGLVQNDLKRVIAYSTCSQLGYMAFAAGISNYFVSMYHLSNHAFFKAALFMGAGSVIHAFQDEQDMRKFGGLYNFLYYTFLVILIGSLSLMGFPFLTGFFSKDAIIETGSSYLTIESSFGTILALLAAFTTAFYSVRSLSKTFLVKPMGFKYSFEHSHESGNYMNFPLILLSVGGILIGFVSKEFFIGLGTSFWSSSLYINPNDILFFEIEQLNGFIKTLPFWLTLIGASTSFILYNTINEKWQNNIFNYKLSGFTRTIYTFLNRKWFFDKIYNEIINQKVLEIGYKTTYQKIDRGILELLGPQGINNFLYTQIKEWNSVNISFVYHFSLIFIYNYLILGFFFIVYWSNIFTLDFTYFVEIVLLCQAIFLLNFKINS